jgi:Na+-driven multidrug efflux pump
VPRQFRGNEKEARNTVGNAIALALLLGGLSCCLLELNGELAISVVSGAPQGGMQESNLIATQYLRYATLQ